MKEDKPMDEYERTIMEEVENENFEPVRNEKIYNQVILGKAFESLSREDEKILRAAAEKEGIPYTSILMKAIHTYAEDLKKKQVG